VVPSAECEGSASGSESVFGTAAEADRQLYPPTFTCTKRECGEGMRHGGPAFGALRCHGNLQRLNGEEILQGSSSGAVCGHIATSKVQPINTAQEAAGGSKFCGNTYVS
jgi:hypothetical protein